jgi:two-component system sensor histidine kinase YesM
LSKGVKSLRGQIIRIVSLSLATLIIFQFITIIFITRDSFRHRLESMEQSTATVAASLNALSRSISGTGRHISSFDAFQDLYIRDRQTMGDRTQSVVNAFNTMRFIATNYPFVSDVVVVPINMAAFSYLNGVDYSVADRVRAEYDLTDPFFTEDRFLFFEDTDYFVYATPITDIYSSIVLTEKTATCIIMCDLSYVTDLLHSSVQDEAVGFVVSDESGRVIVSTGSGYEAETIVAEAHAAEIGLTVRAFAVTAGSSGSVALFIWFAVFSVLLLIFIMITVILLLQSQIAKPISKLVEEMNVRKTSHLPRLKSSNIHEIDRLITGFNMLLDEIEENTSRIFKAQEELYEMEVRKNKTEVYALQSQINPHFIFNTLQCIRGIALMENVESIARISLAMAEVLRYSIDYTETVPIPEEIGIIHRYAEICSLRFRDRFIFKFEIEPAVLEFSIGRMILQPLVENAVKHGVSQLAEDGVVRILGSINGDYLEFRIEDNGPGLTQEQIKETEAELSKSFTETLQAGTSHSYGLYNINRRLKLFYSGESGLKLERQNGITSSIVRLRAVKPEDITKYS